MVVDVCWLIAALLLGVAWLARMWQPRCPSQPGNAVGAAVIQRVMCENLIREALAGNFVHHVTINPNG